MRIILIIKITQYENIMILQHFAKVLIISAGGLILTGFASRFRDGVGKSKLGDLFEELGKKFGDNFADDEK